MTKSQISAKLAKLQAQELKLKAELAKAEDPKVIADVVDRVSKTRKLLAWAKKTNHTRLAINAEYALSKGGFIGKNAIAWATDHGFKA